ncbi:MAG: DJ-1/PfpI family protein [Clostridia bacterium]|nr:DJ-1/PfpI family protein [Clostridia bacterium]
MVYIFLSNGFEEIEALTQVDYLRRAGIEIYTVGIDGDCILGAHNIPVVCDKTIHESGIDSSLEMVILPGGLGGVEGISGCEKALDIIDWCVENDRYVAAICAAPTILAKKGYLNNKHAVCYPAMLDELSCCCDTTGRVAVDGKFITAAAAGVSEEFSFELISVLKGKDAANAVRDGIAAR